MAEIMKREADVVFEDYGTKPVPKEQARNWLRMGIVIWGVSICIPAFMLGGIVGSGASLWPAIIATLLGALILTVISIATGILGAHTRLATAMTSKLTFGIRGNILMAILMFIGAFGWFGVQLEVFGLAIAGGVDMLSNGAMSIPGWIPIIIGGIMMTSTALIGYRAIEKLSILVVPILLILLVVSLIKAFGDLTLAEVALRAPASPMPFGILVSIVAGAYAVGATIQPDITRYSKGIGHAAGGMVFGMMIGFPLIVILAAILAAAVGHGDFVTLMLQLGGAWGLFAMFVIVFATWTTNDNNLYSAALAFNAMFPKLKKWHVTLIGGVAGTILALAGILGHFVNWMIALGITIPPIAAVMAIDFFLFRSKEYHFDNIKSLPSVRVIPIISWVVAVAFGYLTYAKVFTFTGAPALDGLIVALVVHFILMLATGHRISVLATGHKISLHEGES